MSMPLRSIIRPGAARNAQVQQRQRRDTRLRSRLEQERVSHSRWMARLKRAFHAVEKSMTRIARLERQLSRQEEA